MCIVTHMLAHCHRKVKHMQFRKCVHILWKLFSTGPHSAFGSCSLRVTSLSPLSHAVVTSDVTQPPQWVQQVAVCWIQQVASCSAVLPSESCCTAPSGAGPLPTAGPGKLTPAGISGQHRARTRDLVITRLTTVEQGLSRGSNNSSASRDTSQSNGNRRFINSNLQDKKDVDNKGFETSLTEITKQYMRNSSCCGALCSTVLRVMNSIFLS